ncbi:hypothetical protein Tco_0877535 [Tanacetum coccineum]|uniref:Uncharacterized protein n=1 Tax=Tanacetum coccineum TaxID=301880 RepID=A0ABQ5BX64_9ASTR
MKDVFVSVENNLDETLKQNEFLKDRLLEASLAKDVKNLVITSCVKIRNKDLYDEIERISKVSKDVSNESKTANMYANICIEVTQELLKIIVELEKDLSKFEAKNIVLKSHFSTRARGGGEVQNRGEWGHWEDRACVYEGEDAFKPFIFLFSALPEASAVDYTSQFDDQFEVSC